MYNFLNVLFIAGFVYAFYLIYKSKDKDDNDDSNSDNHGFI